MYIVEKFNIIKVCKGKGITDGDAGRHSPDIDPEGNP